MASRPDGSGGAPSSDLARATTLAVRTIASLGSDDGPPIWTADADAERLAIPELRWAEVEQPLTRAEADARTILETNRVALERVADALRERTRIGEKEIVKLTQGVEAPVVCTHP